MWMCQTLTDQHLIEEHYSQERTLKSWGRSDDLWTQLSSITGNKTVGEWIQVSGLCLQEEMQWQKVFKTTLHAGAHPFVYQFYFGTNWTIDNNISTFLYLKRIVRGKSHVSHFNFKTHNNLDRNCQVNYRSLRFIINTFDRTRVVKFLKLRSI